MKYRTRPAEVEARQWDGTERDAMEVIAWIEKHGGKATYVPGDASLHGCIILRNDYGVRSGRIEDGHWVTFNGTFVFEVYSRAEFTRMFQPVED